MKATVTLLVLVLAACAGYDGAGLKPGVSNESDVHRSMGEPALVLANPDGSRQLAYPRGPLGLQTYMVRVGADGRVQQVQNVLDEDHFHRVQAGLTRDDILRLIGPPSESMQFPRMQQVAWDYRFQDTWGYTAIFSVIFDANGIVVGKFTKRLDRVESHR
jgi:hypothetical protein